MDSKGIFGKIHVNTTTEWSKLPLLFAWSLTTVVLTITAQCCGHVHQHSLIVGMTTSMSSKLMCCTSKLPIQKYSGVVKFHKCTVDVDEPVLPIE